MIQMLVIVDECVVDGKVLLRIQEEWLTVIHHRQSCFLVFGLSRREK
jgi:hypothetical protein